MAYNPMAFDTVQDPDQAFNNARASEANYNPSYLSPASSDRGVLGDKNWLHYPETEISSGAMSPTRSGSIGGVEPISMPYSSQFTGMPKTYTPVGDPGAGKTESDVAKGLGTVSKIAAFLPGVGSIISGVSALGSVIMNWWAAGKQMDANKKAQAEATKLYNQQMAESTRRYDIESAMKQKELKLQEKAYLSGTALATEKQTHEIKMDEEKLKLAKEQNQWDKWLMLMTNVSNMMSSPQSRAGFAQIYK